MKSSVRMHCEYSVIQYSKIINQNLSCGNLLYVGIAGDPPGGEYSNLFSNFNKKTFDFDKKWGPDIVGDITKTNFEDNSWDIILCAQVIQHISNIQDLSKEIYRILKPNGYLIIDCPWQFQYHADPSFGDYWRISKDGFKYLFKDGFKFIQIKEGVNTSCLLQKQ